MTQLRRLRDVDLGIFQFWIFDVWMHRTPLSKRAAILKALHKDIGSNDEVALLEHYSFEFVSTRATQHFLKEIVEEGYEGIVLKTRDGYYEHRRSASWCKLKPFDTADCKVIGLETGSGKFSGMLGALVVEFGGKRVHVGGGYTDEQRIEFLKNMPSLIEVGFQEVTPGGSLRFPVFVRVRDDKD